MEAIQPGSSTVVRSPKADEAFIKDDRHSYENFEIPKSHDQPPPESSAAVTYDDQYLQGHIRLLTAVNVVKLCQNQHHQQEDLSFIIDHK